MMALPAAPDPAGSAASDTLLESEQAAPGENEHRARADSILGTSFPDAPQTRGSRSLALGQAVSSGSSLKNLLVETSAPAIAFCASASTSMADSGGASQDPPEADVEDLQRRSKSMPHRKDSTDSEAGRQVGFDLRNSSDDDDSFQGYNRNEDTEAIVEACILHT